MGFNNNPNNQYRPGAMNDAGENAVARQRDAASNEEMNRRSAKNQEQNRKQAKFTSFQPANRKFTQAKPSPNMDFFIPGNRVVCIKNGLEGEIVKFAPNAPNQDMFLVKFDNSILKTWCSRNDLKKIR